ncbi:hypothetical protein Tco_0266912 [Tanacetum coccineum]
MEAKSFEERLAEARQDISLASEKFHKASEKFHRSIIAATKEEKNQEGQFHRVSEKSQIDNSSNKRRKELGGAGSFIRGCTVSLTVVLDESFVSMRRGIMQFFQNSVALLPFSVIIRLLFEWKTFSGFEAETVSKFTDEDITAISTSYGIELIDLGSTNRLPQRPADITSIVKGHWSFCQKVNGENTRPAVINRGDLFQWAFSRFLVVKGKTFGAAPVLVDSLITAMGFASHHSRDHYRHISSDCLHYRSFDHFRDAIGFLNLRMDQKDELSILVDRTIGAPQVDNP